MNIHALIAEVKGYIESIDVNVDGETLWSNYQDITAISMRLQQIRNDISEEEIFGTVDPELKKFRTMILDPTIERLDRLAAFESRKMTGKQMEWNMSQGKG